MARVRLSKQAEADLKAIIDFFEGVSPNFAMVLEENLVARLRKLEQFPRMGRMVPEIKDEAIWELIYRGYRIVHLVDDTNEEVDILTIFHSSKQFGELPGEG